MCGICATPLTRRSEDTGMQSDAVCPKPDARGRDTRVNPFPIAVLLAAIDELLPGDV